MEKDNRKMPGHLIKIRKQATFFELHIKYSTWSPEAKIFFAFRFMMIADSCRGTVTISNELGEFFFFLYGEY